MTLLQELDRINQKIKDHLEVSVTPDSEFDKEHYAEYEKMIEFRTSLQRQLRELRNRELKTCGYCLNDFKKLPYEYVRNAELREQFCKFNCMKHWFEDNEELI